MIMVAINKMKYCQNPKYCNQWLFLPGCRLSQEDAKCFCYEGLELMVQQFKRDKCADIKEDERKVGPTYLVPSQLPHLP